MFWGTNYSRDGPGTGSNWFKWTPTLASAGRYRGYARWIASGYSTQAKYRVFHNGGETITTVNQTQDGGRWMVLGDYDMTPSSSHRVEIRDDGVDGASVADAVRFVRLAETLTVQADAIKFVPNTAEDLLYVHSDHLSAPQKLSDGTGAVVWDASFRPYGEEDAITGAADTNQRFPGQYFDIESALHYNYRRDYDPTTGRYMQSDPIGLAGGINTYAYVGGNPVRYVDPTGEFGIVGAAAGATVNFYVQFFTNLYLTGDWRRALKCVDFGDVLISAALGAVGPTLLTNVMRGKAGPAWLPLTASQNRMAYPVVASIGFVNKREVPPLMFGNNCECEGLSLGNIMGEFVH